MISVAHANGHTAEAIGFVNTLNNVVLVPLIGLLAGIAFLVFIWGCFQYVVNANNAAGRETGSKHIMWGIIGLVIMLSAYSILIIATSTLGVEGELEAAKDGSIDIVLPGGGGAAGGGNTGTGPGAGGGNTGPGPGAGGGNTGTGPGAGGGNTGTGP